VDLEFLTFPQIHSVHHNNKPYSSIFFEIPCFDDWSCGFARLNLGAKFRAEKIGSPTISTAPEHVEGFIL
jgi:hypothetical protein